MEPRDALWTFLTRGILVAGVLWCRSVESSSNPYQGNAWAAPHAPANDENQPLSTPPPPPHPVTARPWGDVPAMYNYQTSPYYRQLHRQQQTAANGGVSPIPKVMRSVGNTGVAVLFMVLTVRTTHLYELADQVPGVVQRYSLVTPVAALFLSNIVGLASSLAMTFSPQSRMKNRLKVIMVINAVSEVFMLAYNMLQLLLGRTSWVPKDVYIGRILANVWFFVVISTFARTRWVSDNAQ